MGSATSFRSESWSSPDGLPQNSVNAIVQGRDGYLWLATFGGLVRFDGQQFRVFDMADTPGIGGNRVLCVFEDSSGVLWAGLQERGLLRLENGLFSTLTPEAGVPSGSIHYVGSGRPGGVWVGGTGGAARSVEGEFEPFSWSTEGPDSTVNYLFRGSEGALWIGGAAVLTRVDAAGSPRTWTVADGLSNDTVNTVVEDPLGRIWIGTGNGLATVRDDEIRFLEPVSGEPLRNVRALLITRDGRRMWVGGQRLMVLDPGAEEPALHDPVIESEPLLGPDEARGISALYEDREGNLWVGTETTGLLRLREAQLRRFSGPDVIPGSAVLPVVEDSDGSLLIGSGCGWLTTLRDGVFGTTRELGGRRIECIRTIARRRNGELVVGHGDQLSILGPGGVRHLQVTLGGESTTVHMVFESKDDSLWLGTEHGLARYDGVETMRVTEDGLAAKKITCGLEDRAGVLWFGSVMGVVRWDDGLLTELTSDDGLARGAIRAIHQDSDGVLWFGSYGGGLTRYDQGRMTTITTEQGLIENVISAILEDDDGNLWTNGNLGVSMLERSQLTGLVEGRIESVHPVFIGARDGAAEGNGGVQSAGCRTRDGRLWFATINGLQMVDPRSRQRNSVPPALVFEGVKADGASLLMSSPIRVAPGTRDLEISYAGISLRRPELVRYRYRLDGRDQGWVEAGSRRLAIYTDLAPGSYDFQMTACNEEGLWNASGASLAIEILPSFHQRPAFLVMAFALFVFVMYTAHSYRIRSITRQRAELEQRVAERTADLEAAYREMEAFSYSVSHDLRAPLRAMNGFVTALAEEYGDRLDDVAKTYIQRVRQSVTRMSELIDGILALARVSRADVHRKRVDLAVIAQEICEEVCGREPQRRVEVEISRPNIVHGDPILLRAVLHNLIENAWKFSRGRDPATIHVGRENPNGEAVVFVRDNGAGFDMSRAEGLFKEFQRLHSAEEFEGLGVGLSLSHRVIARHGGRIWADGQQGVGATFYFSLPEAE